MSEILDELNLLFTKITSDNTVRSLSNDSQKDIANFFYKWAEVIISQKTIDSYSLAGYLTKAFCLGHDWTAKHWTLWAEKK